MHLSRIILIFTSNGQGLVGEFNSCSNTENSLNSIISCHKVKSFFSLKSLQKFNSNDVFQVFNLCFVKH